MKISLPLTITTEKISNVGKTALPVSDVMATTQANPISTVKIDEKPPIAMPTTQRSVARASFFNALTTPTNLCPISSSLTPPSKAKSMDYTVRISPAKVGIDTMSASSTVTPVNSSQVSPNSRPNTLPTAVTPTEKVYLTQTTLYSATASPDYAKVPLTSTPITTSDNNSAASLMGDSPVRSRSVGSNIPRPNASSKTQSNSKPNTPTDPESKQRKVPPPPPPRKSSKTAGTVPVNNISDELTSPMNNVNGISTDKGSDIEVTKNMKVKDISSGQKTSLPISSTPLKSSPAKKPLNRFEKDIVAGIYSNMNRPDLQNQKISHQEIIQRNERHESSPDGSASVSSESSVDSQQGFNGVVKNVSANKGTKKPRPEPPVRKSSVLSNANGDANKNNNNNAVMIQTKSVTESTTIKSRVFSHKSGSKPVVATRRKTVQETCID